MVVTQERSSKSTGPILTALELSTEKRAFSRRPEHGHAYILKHGGRCMPVYVVDIIRGEYELTVIYITPARGSKENVEAGSIQSHMLYNEFIRKVIP